MFSCFIFSCFLIEFPVFFSFLFLRLSSVSFVFFFFFLSYTSKYFENCDRIYFHLHLHLRWFPLFSHLRVGVHRTRRRLDILQSKTQLPGVLQIEAFFAVPLLSVFFFHCKPHEVWEGKIRRDLSEQNGFLAMLLPLRYASDVVIQSRTSFEYFFIFLRHESNYGCAYVVSHCSTLLRSSR